MPDAHENVSHELADVRRTLKRGSVEELTLAELQVIRAAVAKNTADLARLAAAVTGDPEFGNLGLVEFTRELGTRLESLEKRDAIADTEKKTTARNLALIVATISAVSAAISWGLQWLAG